ncbi:hypothetical protein VVR12_02160 [Rothia sp. LK2588]|uniref:hypothetical protein n=1 Tax=Rothia sp. LK2588 TaxID=3114369 RepID=UPI0034CF6E86
MTETTPTDRGASDEGSAYLHENFVTEDGIEVPPPTRPMGPRRLARYREDAAAYLRAKRDGTPFPEEPVAYMPLTDDMDGTRSQMQEVEQRFNALAAQGDISTEDDDAFVQGGKDTRDDVAVSDGVTRVAATSQAVEPGSASDISFGGDVFVDEIEVEESDPVEAEPEAIGSADDDSSDTVAEPESAEAELLVEEHIDEESLEVEPTSEESGATEQIVEQPSVEESVDEETLEEEPAEYTDEAEPHYGHALPEPVRAIDAQGLDLEGVDATIEDDDDKKPWSKDSLSKNVFAEKETPVEEADTGEQGDDTYQNEQSAETSTENRSGFYVTQTGATPVVDDHASAEHEQKTEATDATVENTGGSNAKVWLWVLMAVVILALVLVWVMFFQ